MRALLVIAVVLLRCGAPLDAQGSGVRHGGWGGLGFGFGTAKFACDTCRGPWLAGVTLMGHLGFTPNPHMRVGFGGSGWAQPWKGKNVPTIDSWSVLVSYYPRIRGGPFVDAVVGTAHFDLAQNGDPEAPSPAAGTGLGLTLGFGWEVNGGYFTPRVYYTFGNVGALRRYGMDAAPARRGSRVSLGAAVVFANNRRAWLRYATVHALAGVRVSPSGTWSLVLRSRLLTVVLVEVLGVLAIPICGARVRQECSGCGLTCA